MDKEQIQNANAGPLIVATVKKFLDDDMPTYAAALAFQLLFSLFPFLMFLIALLGFLHVPEFFDWMREQTAMFLPDAASKQVNEVIEQLQTRQGGLLSLGIGLALWTASSGVRSMMNAMNSAYEVREGRPLWKRFPLSVLYTLGLAILLLLVAGLMVTGPQALSWLAAWFDWQHAALLLWDWIRWPLIVLLMMMTLALLYYLAPDVEQRFRFISPGAVLAVSVWLFASLGFAYYVQNLADYGATYGSVGAVIILLLFFYLSSAVLLLGAELNALLEHRAQEGKNLGDKELPEEAS